MAFEIFKVGGQLITDCATLKRVTKEIIEDYSKQNTRYLELRSTPKVIGQIETKEQYVLAILEAIAEMSSQLPRVKVGYIVSVNRASDPALAVEAVDLASKLRETEHGRFLVGIELSGDPRKGSFADFKDQFKRAQELGIKVTLHCAETADQKAESQDMIDFKPDRLGHCCFLTKEQIKQTVDMNIPVEICPTSNVSATQCGLAQFLKHAQEFTRLDHNVIICCDDTLLFNTNLSMELFEFCKSFKIYDKEKIKQLLVRNVDAIFLDDPEFKQSLKDEILSKY